MAGVQAGRLSIEIVAEIARLQQDLDRAKRMVNSASGEIGRSARSANDNLAQGTMGVATSFNGLARQADNLRAKLSPLVGAQQAFAREVAEAERLYRAGAISLREYQQASDLARQGFRQQVADINSSNRAMQAVSAATKSASAGIAKTGTTSRLAGHHMANLSFQLQDIAIGLQGGQKPMTVFLQQGGQIAQIMAQAGLGVGGLAKAIGSMTVGFLRAHPLLTAASAAAGLAAGGIGLMTAEINKNSSVTVTWTDTLLGTFDAIKAGLSEGVTAAFAFFGTTVDEVWAAIVSGTKTAMNFVIGVVTAVPRALITSWNVLPGAVADIGIGVANLFIDSLNGMIQRAVALLNGFVAGANLILRQFDMDVPLLTAPQIGRLENSYRGAAAKAGQAYADVFADTVNRDFIGELAGKISPYAEARARQRLAKDAEEAGKGAGRAMGRAMADSAAKELAKQFDDAFKFIADDLARADEIAKAILGNEETIEALKREAAVLGKVGWERERLLHILEYEAKIRPILIELKQAEAAHDVRTAAALRELIRSERELLETRLAGGNREEQWRAETDALNRYNAELLDTIHMMEQLGGLGEVLGGVLGFFSGNIGGLRGPLGALLNIQTGQRRDEKTGEVIAVRLGDVLRDIFGSDFSATMTKALLSAGIGMAAGQMAGARGTGGQIGSAAGGILGSIAGKALEKGVTAAATSAFGSAIGGALGSAVPVVGTILGGVLGGLVGDMFGGKSARAVVTGSGANVGGSNKGGFGASGDMGNAVLSSLNTIADQLGATLGHFQVAIGVRGDDIRVNTAGTSMKTGKGARSFGQDAEAAVMAAIDDAIRDGALQGLSRGANALLRRGGDIDVQLQKALAFEGVFKALEEAADPAAAAMKQFEAEFAALKAIFDEAGATAEEYAKLEELRAIKRAELERQGGQASEDLTRRRELEIELMQLQGDYMGALAMARQQELAELPEALHALQEQVWAAQLLNDRRLLEIRLMEAQGNAAGALAAQRELELAATHESLRGLKQQVWALEDAREAARAAEQLREAWSSVSDGIMEEVRRIRGLAGAGEGESFARLLGQFNAMSAAARGGDIDAARNLPGLSQAVLRAAEQAATSRQELDRVRAQTAASLEATNAAIAAMSGSDAALLAAAAAPTGGADHVAALTRSNASLREELAQLRAEMKAGLAVVAGHAGRVADKLDDVTSASGGDAITTVAA